MPQHSATTLTQNIDLYKEAISTLQEGFLIYDNTGTIIAANAAALKLLRVNEKTLIQQHAQSFPFEIIDRQGEPMEPAQNPAQKALRTKKPQEKTPLGVRFSQDDVVWLAVTATPLIRKQTKEVYAAVVSFTDITSELDSIHQLTKTSQLESLLRTIANTMIETNPMQLDRDLYETLRQIGEFFKQDACYLFEQPTADNLSLRQIWVSADRKYRFQPVTKRGISLTDLPTVQKVLRKKKLFYLTSRDQLPKSATKERAYLQKRHIESLAIIPLCSRAGCHGFLGFSSSSKAQPLSNHASSLLQVLGTILSNTLVNIQVDNDLAMFQSAVEHAFDQMVITDPDGKIVYANESLHRITGFHPHEVIGKNPKLWGGVMPTSYYKAFWHHIKEKKKDFHGEIINKRRNGQQYTARVAVSPILDDQGTIQYFLGIEQDITKQNETEKQLAANEKKFRAIFEDSADGIALVNRDRTIRETNPAASKILGYTTEELANKTVTEYLHPDDAQKDITEFKEMIQGKRSFYQVEMRFSHKQGYHVWILLSASAVHNEDGKTAYVVYQMTDITRLKEIDRMKTEFISLASHQLRTPLSAMRWYSEMLLNGDAGALSSQQTEYAQRVYSSILRMIQLVNGLLNISRIESGRIKITPRKTDIDKLITDIIDECREDVLEKKLTLKKKIEKNLPLIPVDRRMLHEVISNLVNNAIKYSPENSTITVSIETKGDQMLFAVKDNGMGIPIHQQHKIFQKFFRADNAQKAVPDGSGLGLYMIRLIMESVNGQAWFDSTQGKGTTFYVMIPISGMKQKEGEVQLS